MRIHHFVASMFCGFVCVGCGPKGHRGPEPSQARPIQIDVGGIEFVPPHVRGDRDFKGHGPRVLFRAELAADRRSNTVGVRVYMEAREWEDGKPEPDHTTVEGWTEWRSIPIPRGLRLLDLAEGQESRFEHQYVDRSHKPDGFEFPPHALVRSLRYIGDAPGNDAGSATRVAVRFNPVRVVVADD